MGLYSATNFQRIQNPYWSDITELDCFTIAKQKKGDCLHLQRGMLGIQQSHCSLPSMLSLDVKVMFLS